MKTKLLFLTGIVAVLAITIWWAQRPETITVKVALAESGDVQATVTNTRSGTIKACRRSKLSMPSGGVVDQLLIKEGQTVQKGQLLLELWNQDRKAQLNMSKASYQAALAEQRQSCIRSEFESREAGRQRTLLNQQLTSEETADSAETQAISARHLCEAAIAKTEVAKAHTELQQALLNRTRLLAPFTGVVAEINGEIGEYITPSPPGVATPPAVDLIDYSCLYITAPIDEVDAGQLQKDLPVQITLDAFRQQALTGKLIRIAPYVTDLEKQARTVDIDVELINPPEPIQLLVGYSADLTVILDQRQQTLRVPTETLVEGRWLWTVDWQGRLAKQTVETGLSNWHFTEITAGLKAGQQLVLTPDLEGLTEGLKVVIAND
jgi:HlyD family secretion protein